MIKKNYYFFLTSERENDLIIRLMKTFFMLPYAMHKIKTNIEKILFF